ncbi:MAG: hypothetical protein QXD62_01005 [Candidatus Woesearchaeota archaeon]
MRNIKKILFILALSILTFLISCEINRNGLIKNIATQTAFNPDGTFHNFEFDEFNLTIFIANSDLKLKEGFVNSIIVFFVENSQKQCEKEYQIGFKFGRHFICEKNLCIYKDTNINLEEFLLRAVESARKKENISNVVKSYISNQIKGYNQNSVDLSFLKEVTSVPNVCYEIYSADFEKKIRIYGGKIYY